MKFAAVLLFAFFASSRLQAAEPPQANGVLEGVPVEFPEMGVAAGAASMLDLLRTCHARDDGYALADLDAAKKGDHVRLVFATPVELPGEEFAFAELVFTQPTGRGVFWLRSGADVRRWTKFLHPQTIAADAWIQQGRPVEKR